ncbi:MAG: hypothetical protein MHM6MM_004827 [Cercozoa sp. M6MM]
MGEATLDQAVVAYLQRRAESETDESHKENILASVNLLQEALGAPALTETAPGGETHALEQLFVEGQQALRRRTYHSFLRRLARSGFFEGTSLGDEEFLRRLERARRKYIARHPTHTDAAKQAPPYDLFRSVTNKAAAAPVAPSSTVDEPPSAVSSETQKEATQADKDRATALKNEGNALLRQRQFDEALAKYAEAASLWPTNAIFYANRAAVFSMQKRHEAAEREARRAVSVDASYRKGHTRLAAALEWQGRLDEAAAVLTNALAIFDDTEAIEKQLQQVEAKIVAESDLPQTESAVEQAQSETPASASASASASDPLGAMGGLGGLMGMLGGMGGASGPGAAGGMGGMLGGIVSQLMQNPAMMQGLLQSPAFESLRNNPDFFDDSGNMRPDAMQRIMSDPQMMQQLMQSAGPLLGGLGGLFGAGGPASGQ